MPIPDLEMKRRVDILPTWWGAGSVAKHDAKRFPPKIIAVGEDQRRHADDDGRKRQRGVGHYLKKWRILKEIVKRHGGVSIRKV